jgi:hypothetical protein
VIFLVQIVDVDVVGAEPLGAFLHSLKILRPRKFYSKIIYRLLL